MKTYIFCLWMLFLSINIHADSYITLYTKCGKTVVGMILTEMSTAEITQINAYYTSTYPNATYLSSSTRTYNCHSYAWNMTQGGQTCWINATTNNTNGNISNYWNRDYYSSTEAIYAQKKIYYQSDHSAITSSISGMYESKWGRAPLMRHAPEYRPYPNMNKRYYYRHSIISGLLTCNNGSGITRVGVSSMYYPSSNSLPCGSNVQTTWGIESAKGDDVIGTKANVTVSGETATISFNTPGIYEIYYNIYLTTGENLVSYWFEALVER